MLEPARFLIKDNRTIGGGYNSTAFLFGYYQLFIFLDMDGAPEERKNEIKRKLDRGAPVLVSHYTIIKDLYYKGDF